MSVGGTNPGGADDSSNEALVIVDDNAAQPGAFASGINLVFPHVWFLSRRETSLTCSLFPFSTSVPSK